MKSVLSHIAAVSYLALIHVTPAVAQTSGANELHAAVVDLPAVISLSVPEVAVGGPASGSDNYRSEPSYPLWKVNSTAYIHGAPAEGTEVVGLAYIGAEVLQVGPAEAEWVQVADPANFRIGWIGSQDLSPSEERVALH